MPRVITIFSTQRDTQQCVPQRRRGSGMGASDDWKPVSGMALGAMLWLPIAYVCFFLVGVVGIALWLVATGALLFLHSIRLWRGSVFHSWRLADAEDVAISERVLEARWEKRVAPLTLSTCGSRVDVRSLVVWRDVVDSPFVGDHPRQCDHVTGRPSNRQTLLILHGTGGSSLSFLSVYDGLSREFNVHGLDLPAFGRSPAPAALRTATPDAVLTFYVDVLRAYILRLGVGPVIVVAHSFGGFLAAQLLDRHPELVLKLVLVHAAGIFPLLGGCGAYWAVFFKMAFPQMLLRLMGRLGSTLAHVALDLSGASQYWYCYYHLLASPAAFGDTLVGRFIRIEGLWSWWDRPSIHQLLRTSVPMALVYGDSDTILPAHQALALTSSCDAAVPLFLCRGGGHSVFNDRPRSFVTAVLRACRDARAPGPGARVVADAMGMERLLTYRGTYDVGITSRNTDAMYGAMLAVSQRTGVAGRVFMVDGDDVQLMSMGTALR